MDTLEILARGLLGIVIFVGIAYGLSRDRKNIHWRLVFTGLGFVCALAFLMLKVGIVRDAVELVSAFFIRLIDFSDEGAKFLFGDLAGDISRFNYIVAFHVMPSILFFSALSSLLYYFGILPRVVQAFAWVLAKTFKLSGAECAGAAANVFLGQITAPLVIKPYLAKMSRAEMFSIMTSGMATISGTVMIAFVAMLGGDNPADKLEFAKHLLTASILAAPGALIIAHVILPKTGPVDTNVNVSKEGVGINPFDSVAKGTDEGIRVALTVGAMMIVFVALIAMANWILSEIGALTGLNEIVASWSGGQETLLSFQYVLGTIFRPVAWLLGIDWSDSMFVGRLLGEKIVINEFVAYTSLKAGMDAGLIVNRHSIMIASYALCSFASFTSIGVQIGGFSALAPNQRSTVTKLAGFAVVSGSIACFLGTIFAGVIVQL